MLQRRSLWASTVSGMWLCLLCLPVGCQPRNQFIPPPPSDVTVAHPIERPVQDYFYTTAQTAAVASVELRARVSGYLHEIRFKDGDLVKKDQVLFVIDQAPYQAALDSAKASLDKAKAQLNLAEKQLARTQVLARESAATESTLDIQNAERAAAVADVASAEAALRTAELNLDYTEVKAPFDGRIGRHLVDLGNLIATSETMLATLESVDPIFAYFTLSEHDLLRFMELQKTGKLEPINDADPPVLEIALGSSDNFLFKGKLDFREFGIDPKTGTTSRRAVIPNPDILLVPGLFCRIRAPLGSPRTRVLIDDRAVSTDQKGNFLLLVDDKNVVELRYVTLGLLDGGLRVVESGITSQDRVVINGLQRARPKTTVNPLESTMQARTDNPTSAPAHPPTETPASAPAEKAD